MFWRNIPKSRDFNLPPEQKIFINPSSYSLLANIQRREPLKAVRERSWAYFMKPQERLRELEKSNEAGSGISQAAVKRE